MLYDHCHTNFMSSFRAGFHLSFISADISWLVFPNTVMASIHKITNVLGSEGCCWYWRAPLDICNIAEIARLTHFWISASLLSVHLWKWRFFLLDFLEGFSWRIFLISNFPIQLGDFWKSAIAWHFQPLCNIGYHWDFTGFLHPVPFCQLSQMVGYGWSKHWLESRFHGLFDLTNLILQSLNLL